MCEHRFVGNELELLSVRVFLLRSSILREKGVIDWVLIIRCDSPYRELFVVYLVCVIAFTGCGVLYWQTRRTRKRLNDSVRQLLQKGALWLKILVRSHSRSIAGIVLRHKRVISLRCRELRCA